MMTTSVGAVRLNVAALTHPGHRRANNEDAYLAKGAAYVVADGMGGYDNGEEASAAVVAAFAERFSARGVGDFATVQSALLDADDRVAAIAERSTRGAGSTATGVVLVDHEGAAFWLVFNVGDSRVYRHLGSELEQVTRDHSLGRELIDSGQMTEADLPTFRERNVVTRAIGATDSLADSWLIPVVNGERLLLCSDGLHGEVSDEAIRAILTMNGKTESVARALLDRALDNGGRDNITVIVIDVMAGGQSTLGDTHSNAVVAELADLHDTLTS
jgi:serine/threonine protein phosphatase PrpC